MTVGVTEGSIIANIITAHITNMKTASMTDHDIIAGIRCAGQAKHSNWRGRTCFGYFLAVLVHHLANAAEDFAGHNGITLLQRAEVPASALEHGRRTLGDRETTRDQHEEENGDGRR